MTFPDDLAAEAIWLRRLAQRLVGPGPDAEDLAQETLRVALGKCEADSARGEAVPSAAEAVARAEARTELVSADLSLPSTQEPRPRRS